MIIFELKGGLAKVLKRLFKKKRKGENININTTDTIIGESSQIDGNIFTKASLRIDGQIKGDIESEGDVTIGKKGEARSNIKARNVWNAGTIHGSVHTTGELSILETGKMYGDIHVSTITIASGGQFQGKSTMETKSDVLTKTAATANEHVQKGDSPVHSKHGKSHLHKLDGKKSEESSKKTWNEQLKKTAAK